MLFLPENFSIFSTYIKDVPTAMRHREILTWCTDIFTEMLFYVSIYFLYGSRLNVEKNSSMAHPDNYVLINN